MTANTIVQTKGSPSLLDAAIEDLNKLARATVCGFGRSYLRVVKDGGRLREARDEQLKRTGQKRGCWKLALT